MIDIKSLMSGWESDLPEKPPEPLETLEDWYRRNWSWLRITPPVQRNAFTDQLEKEYLEQHPELKMSVEEIKTINQELKKLGFEHLSIKV